MSQGRTQTPTLINLPPPPQDPMTPSDAPGTPNSTTTSMSELSTVAIKDGHRGHLHHNHHGAPYDAERADRISRLAGLDRVGPRGGGPSLSTAGTSNFETTPQRGGIGPYSGGSGSGGQGGQAAQGGAYFDANATPQMMRERSTVGSASATGSVGGRTTWSNDGGDGDGEDMEVDNSSMGGFSDEGAASLVGFGEGARTPARPVVSPVMGKASRIDRMEGLEKVEDGVTPPLE